MKWQKALWECVYNNNKTNTRLKKKIVTSRDREQDNEKKAHIKTNKSTTTTKRKIINKYPRMFHFDKWKPIELPIFILLVRSHAASMKYNHDNHMDILSKNGPLIPIVDTFVCKDLSNGCNWKSRYWEGEKHTNATHTDTRGHMRTVTWEYTKCCLFSHSSFSRVSRTHSCPVKVTNGSHWRTKSDCRRASSKEYVLCERSRSGIF